jgi:hypothetical protein
MRIPALILALSANALLIACANHQEPAEKLIVSAETAINEYRADGAKYTPDLLQESEAALAKAKQDYAAENYKAVLAAQPVLNEKVTLMRDSIVATQTSMAAATHEWEELSEEVPKMVQAIEVRVDSLSGQNVRLVVGLARPVRRVLSVLIQHVPVEEIGRRVDRPMPLRVTGRDAIGLFVL